METEQKPGTITPHLILRVLRTGKLATLMPIPARETPSTSSTIVHRNVPPGTRTNVTEASDPAELQLRTHMGMSGP